MPSCIYVTERWGIHDERWFAALTEVGFRVQVISRGDDDEATLVSRVRETAHGASILAGPLTSICRPLVDAGLSVVGLSWGFDIPAMTDLTWLRSARGLILDSHASIDAAVAAGVEPSRITFLPWGVDLSVFTMDGPRWRPGDIPDDARLVVSLRAHEPPYRVGDVIDAMAHLPGDIHLALGHSGSLTQSLIHRAEALGVTDRIHAIGTVPEAELPALLRGADAYVSASEVDGSSVTLLQAMACGIPVAVSDIPGNSQWVVPGETGWRFALGDPRDAARAIAAALEAGSTIDSARRLVEQTADWHVNIGRLRGALTA